MVIRISRPHSDVFENVVLGICWVWIVFTGFTFYFFRDPEAKVPTEPNLVVSPGHGKVDAIDETDEPVFMGGRCKRISMFLSVFNVHVQNTPVAGQVKYVKHTSGKFLNAMAAESAAENENVLIGFDSAERPGQKIGARLIAGLIARRIIPWVQEGETVARGERMSLIQFGSRVDVYLPLSAKIQVKLGDKTVGGETVIATLE
ncbi:MAG: phosphatidylserine decarboxylase [Verrucomicrobia bacterium]|nr:phosphatidylserine decarboxylase [Verrucomicrobiota bacterium]